MWEVKDKKKWRNSVHTLLSEDQATAVVSRFAEVAFAQLAAGNPLPGMVKQEWLEDHGVLAAARAAGAGLAEADLAAAVARQCSLVKQAVGETFNALPGRGAGEQRAVPLRRGERRGEGVEVLPGGVGKDKRRVMPAPAGGDEPVAPLNRADQELRRIRQEATGGAAGASDAGAPQGAREGPVEGPSLPFTFIDPSAPKPAAAAAAGPPRPGPGPSAASPGNSSDLAEQWLNGDLDDEAASARPVPPARLLGRGGMQLSDGQNVEEYRQGAAGSAGPPARSREGPRRRVAGGEEEEEEEEEELDESEDESSEYNADAASDEGEEEEDVSMDLESESRSEEEEEPEVDDGFEEADEEEDMEVDGEVPAYPWRNLTAKHLQGHVNEYQALLKKAGMLMEQLDWNLGQAEAGKEVGMGLPAAGHRALLKEAERLLETAKAKKEQLAALPFGEL